MSLGAEAGRKIEWRKHEELGENIHPQLETHTIMKITSVISYLGKT